MANGHIFLAGLINDVVMVPNSGTIEPGSSQAVSVEIITTTYPAEENLLNLIVESNDPENDSLVVPIAFTTEPGILEYTPDIVSLEIYVNDEGEEETPQNEN